MAKQGKFMSGSVGRVVFYELNGESVMRSKPGRVKQSKATKASAKAFGRISRYSRLIRQELAMLGPFDQRDLMLRMNSAFIRWSKDSKEDQQLMQRNIRDLQSLELNKESLLGRNFKVTALVNFGQPGKVSISIPAFKPANDIIAPPYTWKVQCSWMAVRCNTNPKMDHRSQPPDSAILKSEINMKQAQVPEQHLEIPFATIPGDILLVALRLTYFTGDARHSEEVTEKKWVTAGLVGAGYRESS